MCDWRSARRVARPPCTGPQPLPALRSPLQPAGLIRPPFSYFLPITNCRCCALRGALCRPAPKGNSSWLIKSNKWPTLALLRGTAWATTCHRNSPSKSGNAKPVWTGRFWKAPCTSSRTPSATLLTMWELTLGQTDPGFDGDEARLQSETNKKVSGIKKAITDTLKMHEQLEARLI